jgi:hypothetical protein
MTDIAEQPPVSLEPDADAPYGYTIDPKTGQRRAKKRAGRPRQDDPTRAATRSRVVVGEDAEEIQAASPIESAPDADVEPGRVRQPRGRGRRAGTGADTKPAEPVTPFRAGPIAKGVNKLYRRAGRIARIFDEEVGTAIIACTTKLDEDDTTVGEAWEEVCRDNPRIRAFILKAISGGAWGSLFAAHLPIALALFMKESVRSRLPLPGLAAAVLDSDEVDGDMSDLSGMVGGIGSLDLEQMMGFMQGPLSDMMNQRMNNFGRTPSADPLADPQASDSDE